MDSPRLWTGLAGLITYLIVISVYRLFSHPLRNIPGPKLAAVTHLYEWYYDLFFGREVPLRDRENAREIRYPSIPYARTSNTHLTKCQDPLCASTLERSTSMTRSITTKSTHRAPTGGIRMQSLFHSRACSSPAPRQQTMTSTAIVVAS